ncbi:VOC family protein [Streptomyces sp. NPDC002896]|uniref:VOC family protein n=1 Tax=Streptomyces sp. NPDC002896 TaxID=3154438 RepID=UPI00331FE226
MAAALRIELFVEDIDAFADFYRRVLAFTLVDDRRSDDSPYAAVARDGVRIAAVPAWRTIDRAARDIPTGVEIVIEVDDVHADHARVLDTGWPLADSLRQRPWGLTDFRVYDPDGHFIRITGRG